ncbi:MAG TPA: MerR family transcriptional regulator [Gemmatimonadaceae bacterium]|jgi:DNA-binding transcriptional MerR regulator|nr:MerR family transcriptional regulator [Gemmatimonadaceae bacterium]
MIRIGEFARLANVSIKLLRHYDEIGLLPAHAIDRGTGYRYYSVTQLPLLNRLLVYRSLGFSLREIRGLVRVDASAGELRDMLSVRRAALAARIEAERARLDEVEVRITQIDREGHPPSHEVVIRSVDAAAAVSLRRACDSYDEVTELLASLRSKLSARAVTGHGAIWHDCGRDSDRIDCEALVFLDPGRSSHPGAVNLVRVPACTVASVVYDEATEDARPAYRAAIDRASRLGYRVAGPIREHYLSHTAPGSAMIEAQFPLELATRPGAS